MHDAPDVRTKMMTRCGGVRNKARGPHAGPPFRQCRVSWGPLLTYSPRTCVGPSLIVGDGRVRDPECWSTDGEQGWVAVVGEIAEIAPVVGSIIAW